MGYGSYSYTDREQRAIRSGYHSAPEAQFTSTSLSPLMSPYNLKVRESRDSEDHPDTYPVIIALDVTGSMSKIPYELISTGLPKIMQIIKEKGVKDVQVLFLGIGDHIYDRAPLQVGQFESSDELLDKWLTTTYLEKGGGGNAGESYFLAWQVAADYTSTDAFEKRGKRGVLITIGDECTLCSISGSTQNELFGTSESVEKTDLHLLEAAKEKYHCYHIHLSHRSYDYTREINSWSELMEQNLVVLNSASKVPEEIATIISNCYFEESASTTTVVPQNTTEDININQPDNQEEGQIYKPKIIL